MLSHKEKLYEHYQIHDLDSGRDPLYSDHLAKICLRRTWFRVHRVMGEAPKLNTVRTKRRRLTEIPQLLDECRALGWQVHDIHPKTKLPIQFSDETISVQMSAIGRDVQGVFEGWFLIQAGSISNQAFTQVSAFKIAEGAPALYAHCMLGMGLSKVHSCMVFLSSDNGDTYVEPLVFDGALFNRLMSLAKDLRTGTAPIRKSDPQQSECLSCNYRDPCWNPNWIPKVSCYSCHYATLKNPNQVVCGLYKNPVESTDAKIGCTEHLFIPDLLSMAKFIGEKTFENGDRVHIYELAGKQIANCGQKAKRTGLMLTSREIEMGGILAIADPMVQAMKEQFAGIEIKQYPYIKERDNEHKN